MNNSINKILIIIYICTCLSIIDSGTKFAFASDSLKPMIQRVGINGQVETNVQQIKQTQTIPDKNIKKVSEKREPTYQDTNIKKIVNEITDELTDEEPTILSDLKILWEAAVGKSETVRFAIMKLSNPNGETQKEGAVKKILAPLASVAPLLGTGSGNAVAGSSSILGGGLLGSLLSDDSAINNQLSKVNDADLVILAKEIDDLQQKLVNLYYNYITSIEILKIADKNVKNRYEYYKIAQNASPEILTVADSVYRESLDHQFKARNELLSARAALEQFVGNDALIEVEKKIKERTANES